MKIFKNYIILFVIASLTCSCKKFILSEPPKNGVTQANAFKTSDLATATLLAIYQQMGSANGYAGGGQNGIAPLLSLTADEYIGYSNVYKTLYENKIDANNNQMDLLWGELYKRVYDINTVLEGLSSENGVNPAVKLQLEGEAHFLRAFTYFYLVNVFGKVPLNLTTDYKTNSKSGRATIEEIYAQIFLDLKIAEAQIGDNYISVERVRPNKSTVYALLARVYLFVGDWTNSKKYASLVIENNAIYSLVELDKVFLKNSLEAIWQLMPIASNNSPSGSFLILNNGVAPLNVSLRTDFVNQAFEADDQRKIAWVKSIISGSTTYYYPFKYKVQTTAATVSEYTMVFRLAELYLIRSEANTQQNNINQAILDLDVVRKRAGLKLISVMKPGVSKDELLVLIDSERRAELFSEWGDRWLNLKRVGKLNSVMSLAKPNWKPNFSLFPIPASEIKQNPSVDQNLGY